MVQRSWDIRSWMVRGVNEPMTLETREEVVGDGEVLIEVAGCGVCHTDLGFFYDGVPTRHAFPLTLGHEISGRVVDTGAGAEAWMDADVIVPAVIPCGSCPACESGHGSICPTQIFPGNDVHGGFASHVKVPAHGLCRVPDLHDARANPVSIELCDLSVIADAVTTPYQAIHRSGLEAGDLAVVVGVGGVGGFAVQLATALGAHVVALDVDDDRLALMKDCGASLTLRPDQLDTRELRKSVAGFAKEFGIPTWRHRIFECSGTPAGQETAFHLVSKGAYLSVVGFTPDKVTLRLSNLMAFDARAEGNWGCLPEHYPTVLDLVLAGKVELAPFVERHPLSEINAVFEAVHARSITRRVVLTPDCN